MLNKYANPKILSNGIISSIVLLLTARAIKAKTAYGVKPITKLTTSPNTRLPASINCLNGFTFLGSLLTILLYAIATIIAKITIGTTSPFNQLLIRFLGNNPVIVSTNEGTSVAL